jgi:hypothetical protein
MENINWKNPVKNVDYVVVKELPEAMQDKFEQWLSGKRRPIIFNEGDNFCECAYYSDYKEFLTYFAIHK